MRYSIIMHYICMSHVWHYYRENMRFYTRQRKKYFYSSDGESAVHISRSGVPARSAAVGG